MVNTLSLALRNKFKLVCLCLLPVLLSSCASQPTIRGGYTEQRVAVPYNPSVYSSRLPSTIAPRGSNVIVIEPSQNAWGAYDAQGNLIKGGLATAGSDWCPDLGRPCRTKVGTFKVYSVGSPDCKSKTFPLGRGGSPMPYCMFFNGGQAMHGAPSSEVVERNVSHGCVRMHVEDAEWLRYNFVNVGTRVIVNPY